MRVLKRILAFAGIAVILFIGLMCMIAVGDILSGKDVSANCFAVVLLIIIALLIVILIIRLLEVNLKEGSLIKIFESKKSIIVLSICAAVVLFMSRNNFQTQSVDNTDLSTEEVQEYLENSGYRFYIFNNDYKTVGLTNDTVLISLTAGSYSNKIMFQNSDINESIVDVTYEYDGDDSDDQALYDGYVSWLDENGLDRDQVEKVLDGYLRKNSDYYNSEPTTPTLATKFIAGGYEYYDGNYAKDEEVNGSKMHKLFYITGDLHYFSIGDEVGNSTTYFFSEDYAGQSECKYDFKSNSPKEDAICSSDEIKNAKSTKSIFEAEIKKLGITVDELMK